MISRKTIDEVMDLDLAQALIGVGVDLKKSGSLYSACCPIHEEKSPSFKVSPAKNVWKCFGCGEGGKGAIDFLMKNESLSYPEAIKKLADNNGILVEMDDTQKGDEYLKKQEARNELLKSTNFSMEHWKNDIEKLDPKKLRKYDDELIELFDIGYAIESWDKLKDSAINNGMQTKDFVKLGLLGTKNEKVFDSFRDRIMFPIFNYRSELVGFSGGYAGDDKKTLKQWKYINSSESDLYSKSDNLLGIHIAKEYILKSGFAYIVEGNWSLVAMNHAAKPNSVAPAGTALTVGQLKILKKYCKKLVFVYDGDKAGLNAANKNLDIALENGFEVDIVLLPENKDPDDIRDALEEFINNNTEDAITWKAVNIFDGVNSPSQKTAAEKAVTELLSKIKDIKLRINYVKHIAKKLKLSERELKQDIQSLLNDETIQMLDENDIAIPKGADREDYDRYGFAEMNNKNGRVGYWFPNKEGVFIASSNFIIRPLFHVYSADKGDKNKRLIELNNGMYKAILDLPSKNFVSSQQFREAIVAEGNYRFDGSAGQFNSVMGKVLEKLPRCHELTTLGWQPEGFYAFANGIFTSQFKEVDSYGIATHNDMSFFSPAFSDVYKNVRTDDDIYENERFFTYKKSSVKFDDWAQKMHRVYGVNGTVGVAYFIAALFRDLIYDRYKFFPHLFLQGDRGLGKSQMSNSICHIFTNKLPPFNLTAGTNVGFFRKLAQARNSIIGYAEFNHDIDPRRQQALKAAYDGVGHEKGVMSKNNRTETTKVNSSCIIDGQYLPTGDGNALFTRSILLSFIRVDRTQQDKDEFALLKHWEKGGLSGLIGEIFIYRELVEDQYTDTLSKIESTLKNSLADKDIEDRLLMNFSVILSTYKILSDKLKMPQPYDEFFQECRTLIIDLSSKINNSDSLANFWQMMEFLLDENRINCDIGHNYKPIHFDIRVVNHVPILKGSEEIKKVYDNPKKVIFLRLNTVHSLYMHAYKQQTNETGIDKVSLKTYFGNSKAFIGYVKAWRFENGVSGCYAFDYEKLQSYNINLERVGSDSIPTKNEQPEPENQNKLF